MKYLQTYQIFERKGNYQLFHKTSSLMTILRDGYIRCGGGEKDDAQFWNCFIRQSVLPHWKKDDPKFKTISATRNFYYFGLPALELDVEKISDKYRIVPFSENPDFYLDFKGKPAKTKLGNLQNLIRSKDKRTGKMVWRVKTDREAMDFGIAEELILTDKLDVSKYVKRIILEKPGKYNYRKNDDIKDIVKKKYPHIEIVEVDKANYAEVKKEIKEKDKVKQLTESQNLNDLMKSVKYNDLPSFYKLIRSDVNLEDTDVNGNTALLLAAKNNDLAMIRHLVNAGANIRHKNNEGDDFYDIVTKQYKFINKPKDWIEKNLSEFVASKKYNL